jgi:3',5'-cyclic AMP phosphodiesterase CpdA
MTALNRRQFIATGLGLAAAVGTGIGLGGSVWPLLAREDLIPGAVADLRLAPQAWTTTSDHLTFAALGDSGSGGRQAIAVAEQMARTYGAAPFGLVALLGDICYYGNFEDRFGDVFQRPMAPLIDAGVRFELAIGNHDADLRHSDEGLAEIEAELRLLGTPSRYYATSHGPVDFFYLDSSVPGLFGPEAPQQLEWLDDALASATSQWRIVALHHPPYSSGVHGSTPGADLLLEPILARRHVDLVLSGHDHHYERTHPQAGITYVVSGGGCKTTAVRQSAFTAVAASTLQFLLIEVDQDRLTGTCIHPNGTVADRFTIRAREGR